MFTVAVKAIGLTIISRETTPMLNWADYAKIFLALAVFVNPVGAVPLFVSRTAENSEHEKKHISRIASIVVAVVLVIAAVLANRF